MSTVHPATGAARALWAAERAAFDAFERRQALAPAKTRSAHSEQRAVSSGRANLERFDRALAYVMRAAGFRPGYLQQRFIDVARLVLLSRMYGPEIAADWAYLREKYSIKQLYSTAAILFPRRSGKTVAQTLVAAVICASQADGNVCSFNLTGRQSRAWLAATIKWLEYFKDSPEFGYVELARDVRETILIRNCTGTTARISSYPGARGAPGFLE